MHTNQQMIQPARDSEQDLLTRAAAGDHEATRTLIDEAGPVVYGFVFARVGGRQDVTEDLVQSTFLEAIRSAGGFRGEASLTTWMCAIARRQIARHYQSERRRTRLESRLRLVGVRSEAHPDLGPGVLARKDVVIEALGRLTPLHRQVLVLKYLDGFSVAEIAEEIRRSKVQVQSLLQRAREGLRRQLEVSDG